ncbi:11249_t:CDS:2, partial [Racocetra persica]
IKSIEYNIFLKIDQLMAKYFTPHILSAECLEIAQCLYFVADQLQLDIIKTFNEDFDLNLTDKFVEDFYDAKK